jgi:hypothetical protein
MAMSNLKLNYKANWLTHIRRMTHIILTLVLPLIINACATTQEGQPEKAALASPTESTAVKIPHDYEITIDSFSSGEAEYAGFYNNFQYKATLLNSRIREALIARESTSYQWDREKTVNEREKASQEMNQSTSVFVSFYTPDRRNDNITEPKSIWRVYLQVGDRRYEGKVQKVRRLIAEIQSLYPYHTRWNSAYMVTFPISMTAIESQDMSMTITGPLGSKTVEFKGLL